MGSITIRSPLDYHRALKLLETANETDRAILLEAMLQYDCVTGHDRGQSAPRLMRRLPRGVRARRPGRVSPSRGVRPTFTQLTQCVGMIVP